MIKRRQARMERSCRLPANGRSSIELLSPKEGSLKHPGFRSVEIEPSRSKSLCKPINWAKLRDNVLLILEVGALVGLIIVLIALVANLRSLRSEVPKAKITPEPTVTPLIESMASPESIPPPKSDIPQLTRRPIKSPTPTPTPLPQLPTRIVIPAIGVDAPVVEGDGWEELKKGAGHRLGSANPGEVGNCIISGHNDIFGEVFRRLGDLEPGDEIIVYAGTLPYRYIVKEKLIVRPSEMSVIAHTTNPVLTLITCYPYLIDTHRLVVIAELEG